MRPMTRTRLWCAAAGVPLAVALTAGCAGGDAGPAARPAPAPSASANPAPVQPLVELTVTGGFAGVRNRLLVQDDGTYSTSSRTGAVRTGRMSRAELTELRRALEKADFAHLPREATGSPVADGFSYRLTYAGHTVTTDDTTRLPGLREVFAALPDG
ncbi:protealysin inhibitor emfourin [Streptomyces lunaelactis]|uniref:protealysin inhibitor emfourin n=1 Tax=Streptomyces lunaelactis TaxID=1535768 RepID=UPI001584CF3C|nr:protealysin inhibitor emfourin [Streptomyces lunaelactis]NUK58405.1 hypothetical protein [Streptomyces lunaelactis]